MGWEKDKQGEENGRVGGERRRGATASDARKMVKLEKTANVLSAFLGGAGRLSTACSQSVLVQDGARGETGAEIGTKKWELRVPRACFFAQNSHGRAKGSSD